MRYCAVRLVRFVGFCMRLVFFKGVLISFFRGLVTVGLLCRVRVGGRGFVGGMGAVG